MTAIARTFFRLIAALATGEPESMPPEKIEIENGRFKIWSSISLAFQSPPASTSSHVNQRA